MTADEIAGRAAYLRGEKFSSEQPFDWRRGWIREQHATTERKRVERGIAMRLARGDARPKELTKPRGQR